MRSLTKRRRSKICLIYFLLLFSFSFISYAQSFTIDPDEITVRIKIGDFQEVPIIIKNNQGTPLSINFVPDLSIRPAITLNKDSVIIEPNSESELIVTVFGENVTSYLGSLSFQGDINEKIPVNITVKDLGNLPVEALLIDIEPISETTVVGSKFKFKVGVQNLLSDQPFNVTLGYSIDRLDDKESYQFEKSFFEETEVVELSTSFSLVKEFQIPDFVRPGTYIINVKGTYLGLESSASRTFRVIEPFWDHTILGILPVRWAFFVGFFILVLVLAFILYKRKKRKSKRYVSKVDFNLLPKPGPRAAYIGMIAETKKKAYFMLEDLKTHTLVAGSTGGGKTVSAEVIVEEALMKGVGIVVFDPTAQWTGFLRKNTEKKMFALYPKFGLKKTEARAFNGNVRQILNAREIIDIKKFMIPGEINVFSISKLDPEDADILVSNTVREIFHCNLPESEPLKIMVIFDEVHRLLPKFGGSGQGFIQIERAAREFRKWGVGLMLISQVLTDFVGETKANINTEIQMRTRDQGDLDRIKNKYGGYMLQSLLKSATGTGMLENASYNKGNPYFVAFRPLFHEHARLSDKELDNYNKYNDQIDELGYQIDQLEKYKVDVFDLKLELKMALDKVKSGSFNMVDIYLEGLTPRIKEQWKKLGKEPEKRKAKLVSESELREEFIKAQAARKKFEKENKNVKTASAGAPKPMKLADGNMVSKPTELLDSIEAMDDENFKKQVTEEKNDFSDWLMGFNKDLAEKVAKLKTKKEMVEVMKKELNIDQEQ